MDRIITKLYEIIKESSDLIATEESIQLYMYEVFTELVGDIFTHMNQVIKEQKQGEGWKVKRDDWKTVQFIFGPVRYRRTLMVDQESQNHYPLDDWLGIRNYQRHSPLVEVKVAELASKCTYRDTAELLKEWTAVTISHQTVGSLLKRVGGAQAREDEEMVVELDEAVELPEGKKVDYFYAEADGIFVRGTEKRKSLEVRHALLYEGWEKNGKRVSLKEPKAIMTTKKTAGFWAEVQAFTARHYAVQQAQVITNSDGGQGYTADKFQEAFSQSNYPVVNQLDSYHIFQGLNRAFGSQTSLFKQKVNQALKTHDLNELTIWLDTYESTLDETPAVEKLTTFRTYVLRNWDRIFDWREKVEQVPQDARGLGAMESNQRHISFRMKKRGMHWSEEGCEAMVKVKQGILNHTLRDAYLHQQNRSTRQQRKLKQTVRLSSLLHQKTRQSVGAKDGTMPLYASHSSAMGKLIKSFR
ncbi:ISLre2 family transposase [Carnobacterium sp. ISL-102]|uniref:ISLre2 family transposase n=1 Tax=Carnobacterium sp. ISL-102 TaxID=2819142 RepID=UPI001BED114B|nr:ISLre2 family transposase [Carnobacterium sp. ISL-102]MBT2733099.1 ISLre2 family transposase [Carnobacterium sp. ISL-102]